MDAPSPMAGAIPANFGGPGGGGYPAFLVFGLAARGPSRITHVIMPTFPPCLNNHGWQAPRTHDYLMRAMDREQEHDEIRSRAVHKYEQYLTRGTIIIWRFRIGSL